MFGVPEFDRVEVIPEPTDSQHAHLMNDFAQAILTGQAMHTPGAQGMGSLELANAMLLSGWRGAAVSLPLAVEEYEAALQQRISHSAMRIAEDIEVEIDMEKSYR